MIQNINFSDNESDEEERHRFFVMCAENKINDMIARIQNNDENFDRPEEFENEAVSMAIKQHGLRNCEKNTRDSLCDCNSQIIENQNMLLSCSCSEATTSKSGFIEHMNVKENSESNYKFSKSVPKNHQKPIMQTSVFKDNSDIYDYNDLDILNEAVEAAIKKKGLSSSVNSCFD